MRARVRVSKSPTAARSGPPGAAPDTETTWARVRVRVRVRVGVG